MITAVDMAPDGKYARVTRMTKPFSYIVPTSSFGQIEEVWDATGTALAKISERADQSRRAGRPDRSAGSDTTRQQPAARRRRRPRRRRATTTASAS